MHATPPQPAPDVRGRVLPWSALALFAALVLLYLLVVGGPGRGSQGTQGPAMGRHLILFQLAPLTGDSHPVGLGDLSGRVTLINYWGTWCGPCQIEFPHIEDLAKEFGDRDDFRLYAVSCGQGADEDLDALRGETREFLAANHFTLPTYADPQAASRRALVMMLGLEQEGFGYPTTLVLDKQGAIRGFWRGYSRGSVQEMRKLLEELFAPPIAGNKTPADAKTNNWHDGDY